MDDETIDIEEVSDAGEYLPIEEEYPGIEEIEAEYGSEISDYTETLQGLDKEKITPPYLTKYEKSMLIGTRTQALNTGSIPTVEVNNLKKTRDIAKKELEERKIPLIIKRNFPNGEYELWRIDELIFE